MESVKLMNRMDTKYIVSLWMLPILLADAQDDYFVQEIDGKHIAAYNTLYYDTADLDMYHRHHNRQLVRQKIRVRKYVDSDLTFLEIKRKTNKGRTKKKRIRVSGFDLQPHMMGYKKTGAALSVTDFISHHSRYSLETIQPHLRTIFHRITLVNKAFTERLTIDFDLRWENLLTNNHTTYSDLVIIELKRDRNTLSPMADILLNHRIQPFKISKYCIGTILTTPDIKHNRFKPKLHRMEKILTQSHS